VNLRTDDEEKLVEHQNSTSKNDRNCCYKLNRCKQRWRCKINNILHSFFSCVASMQCQVVFTVAAFIFLYGISLPSEVIIFSELSDPHLQTHHSLLQSINFTHTHAHYPYTGTLTVYCLCSFCLLFLTAHISARNNVVSF